MGKKMRYMGEGTKKKILAILATGVVGTGCVWGEVAIPQAQAAASRDDGDQFISLIITDGTQEHRTRLREGIGVGNTETKRSLVESVDVLKDSSLVVDNTEYPDNKIEAYATNAATRVIGLNVADSQVVYNGYINGRIDNDVYDPDAQVYGLTVSNQGKDAREKVNLKQLKNSGMMVIQSIGTNVGTVAALVDSHGNVDLGNGAWLDAKDYAGNSQYVATIQNRDGGVVTLGDKGHIEVGNVFTVPYSKSSQQTGVVYGIDNESSDFSAGNQLQLEYRVTGDNYNHLTGIVTRGSDSSQVGNTRIGDSLNLKMNIDDFSGEPNHRGIIYGIENGDEAGYASTRIGNNATVHIEGWSENPQGVTGISSAGPHSTVTLGDQAAILIQARKNPVGVESRAGGHILLTGATKIMPAFLTDDWDWEDPVWIGPDDRAFGYAVKSRNPGSLVDITGKGQKCILGDLYAEDSGVINLELGTGDSLFQGASKVEGGTTNLSLSNGALWNMMDSSTVTRLDLNSGATVDMNHENRYYPNPYRTLKVDHFSGHDGVFVLKTDLASQTEGDKVSIGAADPGSTGLIQVYDRSLSTGNQVTGARHLLLVTDPSRNTTFRGKALDTGGLWTITPTIEQGGTFTDDQGNRVGNRDQWYLATLARKINPAAVPVLHNLDNTYGLYRMSMDTLRQRLGDLRYRNRSTDRYDIWARNRNGRYEGNGYGSRYNFFQAGLDTMPDKKSAYGFLVERGIASPDYGTGSAKNNTLSGALYGTWLGDDGSYTDVVAKVGRNDTTLHTYGAYADSAAYREKEQSLSVEYGRTLPLGQKGWFAEPQAQFVLGHLGSNDYTTNRGTRVQEDGYDSAIGRLGFVLGKKQKTGKNPYDFYLKASLLHEFGGSRDYALERVNAYGDEEHLRGRYGYGDTWFELGLGATAQLNKNTLLYGDVERSFAGDFNKKWQVNAGVEWSF